MPGGTNGIAFPGTDHFTIEAWINPSWIGATQAIVSKFNHPTNREYFLALDPWGRVVFHLQGSDYVSTTPVPAGQYTHLAATYDGAHRRIYLNGQLDAAAAPGSGPMTNWSAPFVIGARYWSNSLANFFQVVIDDVRVWLVARSQTQIAADMNRRLSGYELGLVAYYRFDEAQGDLAYDSTIDDYLGMFEGPYKWIRLPSLLYLTIYGLGIALLFRSWMGLMLMIPLIWGIVLRINGLEKIYEVRYKKVWSLRRHTSKRLIPRVY